MIKDPYIGMPIVLGRPSKPASNKPTPDDPNGNWQQTPTLPPGHPAVSPGAQLPPGHPSISSGAQLPPGHPSIKPGTPLPPGHPSISSGAQLPPGHPSIKPGTPFPPGHPNCTDGMDSSQEGVPDKTETSPDNSDNMSGTFDVMVLGSLPIAMAYTPMQQWKTTYSPSEALTVGTVFPELNLPFLGHQRRG